MADFNSRGPDCDDCEGERGERGKRGPRGHGGHDGHDGGIGATGATGPGGPTLFGVTNIVFRPGDPEGSRLNVHTTWEGAYAALESVRDLGIITLEFDDRFGACVMPAGIWDFTNTHLTCFVKGSSPAYPATLLTLADGCKWAVDPAKTSVIVIEGENFNILSNRTGPVIPIEGINLLLVGNRVRLINTDPAALPMFVRGNTPGLVNFIGISGNNAYGGLGDGIACPAPLVDCRGGTALIGGPAGFVGDNAFTDSVGGGILFLRLMSDSFTGGSYPGQNYDFPAMAGATFVWSVEARDRHRVNTVVTTSPYNATWNELVRVDSTSGPFTVNAPRANPARGERLVVKDVGGAAGANNITVVGTGGDIVESNVISTNGQAKTWVSDGTGTWIHTATT